MKRWLSHRGRRLGGGDLEARASPAAWEPPPPIEYLVGADNANNKDLLIDDVQALVPSSFHTEVLEGADVLTVRYGRWTVTCSAEDSGWRFSFDGSANQVDAWWYVSEVAQQLSARTEIAASPVQVAGFDGGIFHCHEAFGIESRNLHVLAGTVVHGDIDPSMNVSIRFNSSMAMCIRIDGIDEIRDPGGGSRLGLTRSCGDWDEVEFLLGFGVKDEYLEVSQRPCDDEG